MDKQKLLQSLEDESNEFFLNLNMTNKKRIEMNYNMIKKLELDKSETMRIMKLLKEYRYVDEMNQLKHGAYIRWIPIENPTEIVMKRGAIFCDVKICNEGVFLICKNYGFGAKHFRIKLDECLVFQKLTEQEKILLLALDHLSEE
jgi:hypothetical protein